MANKAKKYRYFINRSLQQAIQFHPDGRGFWKHFMNDGRNGSKNNQETSLGLGWFENKVNAHNIEVGRTTFFKYLKSLK